MPDWSYHTFLKPTADVLFPQTKRKRALGLLRNISRTPVTSWLVPLLGKMEPPDDVSLEKGGIYFPTRLLLAHAVDPNGIAQKAFANFGFGGIEISAGSQITQSKLPVIITFDDDPVTVLDSIDKDTSAPILLSIGVEQFDLSKKGSFPSLVRVPLDVSFEYIAYLHEQGAAGIIYEDDKELPDDMTSQFDQIHAAFPDFFVVVHTVPKTPEAAVTLLNTGADLLLIDQSFIDSGPGFPKRINSLLSARQNQEVTYSWNRSSIAALIFAFGVCITSILTIYIALTSIILPYDTHVVGITVETFREANPNLLKFMAHDRISYAGVALSGGILFVALVLYGIKQRKPWAYQAFLISGAVGFSNFFVTLFLGYIEPGHTFVELVLLPFFILTIIFRQLKNTTTNSSDRDNDRVWKNGLIGQFLFIILSFGLIIAGIVISLVGITSVFVSSDLAFLNSNVDELTAISNKLIPVIAHDRVGFGGALLVLGTEALFLSLWGFNRRERWIWWTLFLAGTTTLITVIWAHAHAGYTDVPHLIPVGIAALFFYAGLAFSKAYLLERPTER